MREVTGRIAAVQPPPRTSRDSARPSRPGTPGPVPADKREPTAPPAIASPAIPPPRAATPVPRPSGLAPGVTAPSTNRTPSPNAQAGSGVVVNRPGVIAGRPAVPAVPTQQRVRKAREDEGLGFGQGRISERSLDEVILAYLSEDAKDK